MAAGTNYDPNEEVEPDEVAAGVLEELDNAPQMQPPAKGGKNRVQRVAARATGDPKEVAGVAKRSSP